jgi:hypothetical protein
MSDASNVGLAGQSAVMSEFALRGYNVAIPEIDKGDDVFVVRHDTGKMWRMQVKTSQASQRVTKIYYSFRVKESAIHAPTAVADCFIFVMRQNEHWRFCLIATPVLSNYVMGHKMGTKFQDFRNFNIILDSATSIFTCSGMNLTHHFEDWAVWPYI